jgi:hypothetical protein
MRVAALGAVKEECMEPKQSVTPPIKNDALEAARGYITRGWSVVPVPRGEKGPKLDGWQNLRIKSEQVGEFFTEGSNIGIQLGEASSGLADVDLDCPEAIGIGQRLLPSTLRSGRGLGDSHYWYNSPSSGSFKFKDVGGDVLLEIRSDGHQTVAFGEHPDGGRYEFSNPETQPREIEAHKLRSAAARVAVSALVARHLPDGGRHDLALAYSGLMLKNLMDLGEDKEDATEYVWQILRPAWEYHKAGRDALDDLYECITGTADKIEADEAVTGGPTIKDLLADGEQIVRKIKDWLGWMDLTPEQREAIEKRQRVKRADKAWKDERVRELAHDADILSRVYETMKDGGLVGEERNAKLLTLVAVTMYLGRPMSLLLNGDSSSGKSYLLKTLIKTLPEDVVFTLQSVSNMGLSQVGKDTLKNKFLMIYELGGLGKEGSEAIEQLKQLLTEGHIRRQIAESTLRR